MSFDQGHYYIYFLLQSPMEKVSLRLWKSLETRRIFFSYFVTTLYNDDVVAEVAPHFTRKLPVIAAALTAKTRMLCWMRLQRLLMMRRHVTTLLNLKYRLTYSLHRRRHTVSAIFSADILLFCFIMLLA